MPIYDDDDTPRSQFDPPREWGSDRDDPDPRDIAPDDKNTIRCTECRKYFFDDSPRCPYCGHYPMEDARHGRPVWFWVALILCLGLMGGFGLLELVLNLMR